MELKIILNDRGQGQGNSSILKKTREILKIIKLFFSYTKKIKVSSIFNARSIFYFKVGQFNSLEIKNKNNKCFKN